jgi:hypothetical protein
MPNHTLAGDIHVNAWLDLYFFFCSRFVYFYDRQTRSLEFMQQKRTTITLTFALFASTLLCGCRHVQQQITGPRGDIRQQQYRAALFDPYALPEIGNDQGGMRPREFSRPLPEIVREQTLAELYNPRQ